MNPFQFQELFPLQADDPPFRLLTSDFIAEASFEGRPIVKVHPDALELLAEQAFTDVAHLYRTAHLKALAAILEDPESSANDRHVALEMLRNAVIASQMTFPMCQDTGTAIVMAKKGQQIWTDINDAAPLAKGIYTAYTQGHLRYSQNAPLDMFEEKNTRSNLPAQIEISAVPGDTYEFLCIAKGGGSANKTFLFQETKAVLNPDKLLAFMTAKMKSLGTSACPPYHLVFVVGGTSAEFTLKTVKLASAGYLDSLPVNGDVSGHAFRDPQIEARLLDISRNLGIGAQFGGKYFCHDVRVIRLPRHGASCPIGLGVSCSADRHIKAKITHEGIFLEQLDKAPERFLPESLQSVEGAVSLDLNQSMAQIREELSQYPVSTMFLLNGPIIVARDIAHARLMAELEKNRDLPEYFKNHIIYYAGPAKTPPGHACGAFGPTTAGRMDAYVQTFQRHGASLVMLAKGNRSSAVTRSCRRYGGFYLGSIGGPAARLGKDCITHMETVAYADLGMEAIFKIWVKDFPAFLIIDDKGNDFYTDLLS